MSSMGSQKCIKTFWILVHDLGFEFGALLLTFRSKWPKKNSYEIWTPWVMATLSYVSWDAIDYPYRLNALVLEMLHVCLLNRCNWETYIIFSSWWLPSRCGCPINSISRNTETKLSNIGGKWLINLILDSNDSLMATYLKSQLWVINPKLHSIIICLLFRWTFPRLKRFGRL